MKEGEIVQEGFWKGAEVISVYTRDQAIDDGVLVDVTETAREAGFTVPVAVTRAVWHLVEPTEREKQERGQSTNGRLWDLLWMAFLAIKRATSTGPELEFGVVFEMHGRPEHRKGGSHVRLKLHSGPGDDGEHVLTIMLPEED